MKGTLPAATLLLCVSCATSGPPPQTSTPSGGDGNERPLVSVWGDLALVQSADAYGHIDVYSLPDWVEQGVWHDVGRVRWIGPRAGDAAGVLVSSFDGSLWSVETGWLAWIPEAPLGDLDAADAARWTFEGSRGDAFKDATVFDVDNDATDEVLLWGFPKDGGTVAASVELDATGALLASDVEVLSASVPQRHLAFDGAGDGAAELFHTSPLEPVSTPLGSLDGSTESLYPATAFALPDLTGDGRDDLVLEADGELVILPSGQYGVPFDALEGRLSTAGCDTFSPTYTSLGIGAADVSGDGVRDLIISLEGCGDFGSVRVVTGPIDGATDVASLPAVSIPEGLWGPDSFYDVDGDGRMDLLVGVADGAGPGIVSSVAVVSGAELVP